MIDGGQYHPRKSRAGLGWVALFAGAVALFVALVVLRMPPPEAVAPPHGNATKQLSTDQPLEPKAVAATDAKEPETPVAPAPEPEPDFDARRFSVELTLVEGAAIWPELFASDVVPKPFGTAASHNDFPNLTAAEWQRWLEPVENETADVSFGMSSDASVARLRGMLQLRCPWPRDDVLQFTPLDSRILMFWFWNGTQGVSLVYHPHGNVSWAAYRLERAADSRRPRSIALASLAGDVAKIIEDRGFNIHHQAGELIVSQTGVRLLSAPFANPPQAVYVNGDSWFRAFGMNRRLALPEAKSADGSRNLTSEPASDIESIPLVGPGGRGELTSRLVKLAMQSTDRGDSRAFEQWNEVLFTLPAWTNGPFETWPLPLALAELVPLVDADRSDEVAKVCRKLRFWNQPADTSASWPDDRLGLKRLIEWAEEMGRVNSARMSTSDEKSQSHSIGWRHPWIVEQGRDALSPALGLATAIADSALDDACKFITETPLPADAGLVPDSRDAHLAVSWPQAIRNALHDELRLVAAMQSRFDRLGELRLSRAVADGDAEAVHTASVQFLGTPIAAEACLELGDRDLALGRFCQALARFQAALRDASPEQADRLEQRTRLAACFIGMDVGRPARASVSLNDKALTVEQFEALLAAQRRRATVGKLLPTNQMTSRSAMAPRPGRYELRPVVSWESAASPKTRESATIGDQVCLTAQGTDSIYVTGALGTTAIGLQEQSVRWSHPPVPDPLPRPHPTRIASAGDRLFWSRPTASGLELTCLDPISGAVKWRRPHSDLPVISGPVWSQRQLFAVTARPTDVNGLRIALCELNPDTGEILAQTDVGGLAADPVTTPYCVLTALDDRLVLASSAAVLCCDREGKVHWLQRSTWLPPEIRSLLTGAPGGTAVEVAILAQPNAPLIVLQPGAAGLQAFDLETGRRVWQRAIPDLYRIVGASGGLIVALTPRGLLACQAADGAFAWQRDPPASPFACGMCDDGQVITATVQPGENGKQQLTLQWIASGDSANENKTSVELPEPHMGSVVCLGSLGGRFFVVVYDAEQSAARLLELVSAGAETGMP